MKGIILAGGNGTRLYPLTKVISKQLLAVYDKPMIYYPLSVLMLAGIREILIISTPSDLPLYQRLLEDGSQWGITLEYAVQENPGGLAEAFIIGAEFVGNDTVCLILGDNLFYGQSFQPILLESAKLVKGAVVFGYWVKDPQRFGVIEFDESRKVTKIVEKPVKPKSNYIIPGLYFFDNDVIDISKHLKPSDRGELEIVDVLKTYMKRQSLYVRLLGRGFAWLDTGTHRSLMQASMFVETMEERQGLKIACIEEVAYRMGFIDAEQVEKLACDYMNNGYGQYLMDIIGSDVRGTMSLIYKPARGSNLD
jgi:glucose-1-phosphate thymidylyltransferase